MSVRRILMAAALFGAPLRASAQGGEELRLAVLTNEQAPEDWYAYGRALYKAEKYRDAIGAFQRALQLGVRSPDVSTQIARAYAQLGDERQAQRWTELAQRQYPFASPSPRGSVPSLKRTAFPRASYSIERPCASPMGGVDASCPGVERILR